VSDITYVGGYVRHRGRMVARSVYQDARAVTDATGWTAEPTVGLIDEPVTFIDFFPQGREATAETLTSNTLAIDLGTAGAEYEWEMGGLYAQEYVFSFAINAVTDAVAMALFSDLGDRYSGRTAAPFITLYNFVGAAPVEVVRMEVESFEFAKSAEEVAPGVHLFFARLVITDYLDPGGP
jgi:hypothetical protein